MNIVSMNMSDYTLFRNQAPTHNMFTLHNFFTAYSKDLDGCSMNIFSKMRK